MREVLEETGLQVKGDSVRFLTATNDIMLSEHKHYVTIFMTCQSESENLEPKVGDLDHVLVPVEQGNFLRATADPSIGLGAREMRGVGMGDMAGSATLGREAVAPTRQRCRSL
jgi:ADP-ribose pyrophosphatase YjhB (NUDIX family)